MTWFKDVFQAVRSLRKTPAFTLTAILTLALGIGATAAIFSVVDAVLLRPLPYPGADRLVHIAQDMRARDVVDFPIAPGDFHDFRQMDDTFENVASMFSFQQTVAGDGAGRETERVPVAVVSTSLPALLGFRVTHGRDFVPEDGAPLPTPPVNPLTGQPLAPQGPPPPQTVLLSEDYFQRRFGGDPSIVGLIQELGAQRFQIAGVLARGAELLFPPNVPVIQAPDMWIADRTDFATASRINVSLRVIARLKSGVSLEQARGDMERVGADLRERFPIKNTAGVYFRLEPMHTDLVADVRPVVLTLMGAVVFVLLIACANVANLMLVRTAAREREYAVRTALGGSRARLIRQVLTEGLVLGLAAAAVGLALAQGLVRGLRALGPDNVPRLTEIAIDPTVVVFGVALAVVSVLLFAVIPAVRGSRPNVMDILRRAGRAGSLGQGQWIRNGVVVVEVALSFVLLVGSGLMLRSFLSLYQADPGFAAQGLVTFQLTNQFQVATSPEGVQAIDVDLQGRLAALPSVTAVTVSSYLPLTGGQEPLTRYGREDALTDPGKFQQANVVFVRPGFFDTMGTPLVDGRVFADSDVIPQPQGVIVDSRLAEKMFPGERAVGKRLYVRIQRSEPDPYEIIGVVGHQRNLSPAVDGREAIYFTPAYGAPLFQWAVRSSGDPAQLAAAIRREVAAVSPRLGVFDVATMSSLIDESAAGTRFVLWMLGVFGAVAVILAAVGLYSVLSTAVRQRTAEIGVRMAFGAPARSIFQLIVGHGLVLSAIGVAVGIPAAVMLSRALGTALVNVSATDPLTYGVIAVGFLLVAAVSCGVPARRASKLDPLTALRQD